METKDSVFFNQALEILGWQGGTIHQVMEVLRCAKEVSDAYKESALVSEYDRLKAALQTLNNAVS